MNKRQMLAMRRKMIVYSDLEHGENISIYTVDRQFGFVVRFGSYVELTGGPHTHTHEYWFKPREFCCVNSTAATEFGRAPFSISYPTNRWELLNQYTQYSSFGTFFSYIFHNFSISVAPTIQFNIVRASIRSFFFVYSFPVVVLI